MDKKDKNKIWSSLNFYSLILLLSIIIIVIGKIKNIMLDRIFINVYLLYVLYTIKCILKVKYDVQFGKYHKLGIACICFILLNLICFYYNDKIFPLIYIFYPGIIGIILLFATFEIIEVSPLIMIISFIMIIFFGIFKIELWQIVSLIIICINEFLSYDNIKFNCLKNSNDEIEYLEKNKVDDLKAKHKLSNYKIFLNLTILNMYFSFLISGILEKHEYINSFANLLFDSEGFCYQLFARGTLTTLLFLISTLLIFKLYKKFIENKVQRFVDYAKEKIFGIKNVENK